MQSILTHIVAYGLGLLTMWIWWHIGREGRDAIRSGAAKGADFVGDQVKDKVR